MEGGKKEKSDILLGIDDAGRGPVLGPMVLAGCILTKEDEIELKKLGVKDSKMLTPEKREALVKIIKEKAISYQTHQVTPVEIDTGMGGGLNLNQIEALSAAAIINKLTENLTESEKKGINIIIDCPSNNRQGWLNQLVPYLNEKGFRIRCEHKADRDYPVVSAASIIAKTTRDAEVDKLKKQIGIDFGSGYPADPKTKEFLQKYSEKFKHLRIIRESWGTFKELEAKKEEDKKSKQVKLF